MPPAKRGARSELSRVWSKSVYIQRSTCCASHALKEWLGLHNHMLSDGRRTASNLPSGPCRIDARGDAHLSLQLLPDLPTIPAAMTVQFLVPYCCTSCVKVRSCQAWPKQSVSSFCECRGPTVRSSRLTSSDVQAPFLLSTSPSCSLDIEYRSARKTRQSGSSLTLHCM